MMKSVAILIALLGLSTPTNADPENDKFIRVMTAAFRAGFECGHAGWTIEECMILNEAILRGSRQKDGGK